MSDTELCYAGIAELGRGYRAGRFSPVDVVRAQLDRIEALDPGLHAYFRVLAEEAIASAERATIEIRRGEDRGPLHGIPVAIKDLFYTRGVPTTAGMWIHRDFRPDFDATVVVRLREAGAISLGKTSLTDGAMVENHPQFATPVNPWRADLWAGASSNGSAVATAAGLCTASLGSDTGGSIRIPCTMNGVTGIKPTWGRVSVHGAFALAPSMDHPGPIARSAEDAGHVLQVIAGPDPADPSCLRDEVPPYVSGDAELGGVRVGLDPKGVVDFVEPAVRRILVDAAGVLEQLGATIVEAALPPTETLANLWQGACSAEAALVHEETFPSREEEYGPFLRGFLAGGREVSGLDVARAGIERRRFAGAMDALFAEVDLVLVPVFWRTGLTLEGLVEALAEPGAIGTFARFTGPFDFSGHPTITLPGGFDDEGIPIGFQLVAPHLGEARLVAAGRAFQSATDWHLRRPPV